MLRLLTSASRLAFGIARAPDAGPGPVGRGDHARVVYPEPSRNQAGGNSATITRFPAADGTTNEAKLTSHPACFDLAAFGDLLLIIGVFIYFSAFLIMIEVAINRLGGCL